MCGRFANHLPDANMWVDILGAWPTGVENSYNVSPAQMVATFTSDGGFGMRWGLIPAWSKEAKTKYSTFNAVLETVDKKPLYRGPWKESKRCVLPVLGYYEWRVENGIKQPYFIRSTDEAPLFLGGLWESWNSDDRSLLSCTVLTREPVDTVARIHNRMPVLLPAYRLEEWFECTPSEAKTLAEREAPNLCLYPVNRYVNNARNDGPQCIEPIRSPGLPKRTKM